MDPDNIYFNPANGESYSFGPHQQPPAGWKRLDEIPPQVHSLPPGAMITWMPGMEPRLYVDPQAGHTIWVHYGEPPPKGWKPLIRLGAAPPLTLDDMTYFNPETGESYTFAPGQSPPKGWKKLNPVPAQVQGLPAGVTVSWIPGMEPRLYVDPETGNADWVHHGKQAPRGWQPLRLKKP